MPWNFLELIRIQNLLQLSFPRRLGFSQPALRRQAVVSLSSAVICTEDIDLSSTPFKTVHRLPYLMFTVISVLQRSNPLSGRCDLRAGLKDGALETGLRSPCLPPPRTCVGRNDGFLGWWLSLGMLLIKKPNSKLVNVGIYKNYVRCYEKFSAFIYIVFP